MNDTVSYYCWTIDCSCRSFGFITVIHLIAIMSYRHDDDDEISTRLHWSTVHRSSSPFIIIIKFIIIVLLPVYSSRIYLKLIWVSFIIILLIIWLHIFFTVVPNVCNAWIYIQKNCLMNDCYWLPGLIHGLVWKKNNIFCK